MSESLYRIRMEQYIVLMRYPAYLLNRLDRSYLIVGKHYRNEDGIVPYGFFDFIGIDKTVFVDIKICHFISVLLQKRACVQYRMMLDL